MKIDAIVNKPEQRSVNYVERKDNKSQACGIFRNGDQFRFGPQPTS